MFVIQCSIYDKIINALIDSSKMLQVVCKNVDNSKIIPGWNEVCKQAHTEAREAYHMWCCNGKLKQGPIFKLMVKSRTVKCEC